MTFSDLHHLNGWVAYSVLSVVFAGALYVHGVVRCLRRECAAQPGATA